MTTHRSGPPAEHLRIYARALGLPEDSDLATVVDAIRACRAAGVARLDQIPKGPATMAPRHTPPPIDQRSQTLAAKGKTSPTLTPAEIAAWVARTPAELRPSLVRALADDYPDAAEGVRQALAALASPPASPPSPGTLTAREREYCQLYGCSEQTYLRLRSERDAKAAKATAAQLARRRAEREAMARAVASLRGGGK